MVPACMELTAQRRKYPVPASHSLESVGQKGDPSPSWRRREARTRAAGLIQLLLSTMGSLLNTQTLFQSVWAVPCPGVCSVLGDSEAGDPQATLGEIVTWGEKRVCAEAER